MEEEKRIAKKIDDYRNYLEKLDGFIEKREEDFNILVVKINSGTLALSLTLMSVFVDLKRIEYDSSLIPILAVGWLLVIASLVLNLSYSLIANKDARQIYRNIANAIDTAEQGGGRFDDSKIINHIDRCNAKAREIFKAMISLTSWGIVFILLFAGLYMSCPEKPQEKKAESCCSCHNK